MTNCLIRMGAAASLLAVTGWLLLPYFDRPSRTQDGHSELDLPAIECPVRVDLGTVEHGTVVSAPFTVKNSGRSPLVLKGFRSGCACQSVEVKRAKGFMKATEVRLEPNELADMRMVVSINGRGYESFRSVVYFNTNIPDRPEVAVAVVAPRILAGVIAVPSSIAFGSKQINEPVIHKVKLYDLRNNPRQVLRVTADDPSRVTARLILASEGAEIGKKTDHGILIGIVEVLVNTTTTGSVASDVQVYLNDGGTVPEVIRVVGRVKAPVEVSPSSMNLPGSSSSGPIYSATCLVRSNLDGEFDLTVVEVPKGFTVSLGSPDSSSSRMRVVSIQLGDERLKVSSERKVFTIRLAATIGGKRHELEIPVRVRRYNERGQP